jgi:hypothetical protein
MSPGPDDEQESDSEPSAIDDPASGAPSVDFAADDLAENPGYQTTLTEFGAVESSETPNVDYGTDDGRSTDEATEHNLTPYLQEMAETMETINELAGDVIGEALADTLLAPFGPAGELAGEAIGDAIGTVLDDVWYSLAQYVSDQVAEPQGVDVDITGSDSSAESGDQTSLLDFGATEVFCTGEDSSGGVDEWDVGDSDGDFSGWDPGDWDGGGGWDSGDWDGGGGWDSSGDVNDIGAE